MTNLLLLSLAIFLAWVILPIAFLIGIVFSIEKHESGKYWLAIAIVVDIMGGIVGEYFFNLLFVKKDGYLFGKDETISSVIGKNKLTGTLTKAGFDLYKFLDKLDPNHCEKAITNV